MAAAAGGFGDSWNGGARTKRVTHKRGAAFKSSQRVVGKWSSEVRGQWKGEAGRGILCLRLTERRDKAQGRLPPSLAPISVVMVVGVSGSMCACCDGQRVF